MAADDDTRDRATQDAVRRILKKRPPEDLPPGSEARLRQRLDEERPTRKTVAKKKRKSAR